jgi:hypothetical protein
MPHRIDFDGIAEDIFILQNLSLASRSFCEKYQINRYSDKELEFDWNYYFEWLKSIVSEKLIECAINVRILQDFLCEENEDINWTELDQDACSDITLGIFHIGSEFVTVREVCNKIIHAIEVSLVWEDTKSKKNKVDNKTQHSFPEYWNGSVMLEGTKGKRGWKLELRIEEFCIALNRILSYLGDNVDWYHVYKYDT